MLRGKGFMKELLLKKIEIHDKPKLKKRFSNQFHTKLPKACMNKLSNPKLQGGRS